ncbi:MAG: acyl-CoA dehydrogenase [Gemmatimonadales bacterium]|nr:MAG: acyl-CoA dehydrogenase [Gemmatimonadales bacterium]
MTMTADLPVLTAEQLEIRAMAREFAAGEIRPHAEAWDAARQLPDEIFRKVAELGFMGMRVPEEHGGLGLDLTTTLLTLEALAWGDASVALSVLIHGGPVSTCVLEWGTDAQKGAWLPSMASGETLGAFALTEPEAGSDATSLRAIATPDGEGWTIRGTKSWVTNGSRADLLLVFARTGAPDSGAAGLSAFLVPGDAPGIEVGERERTLGMAASESATLQFQDVRVGAEALLGSEGEGWSVARSALVIGRLMVAAQALGIAEAAYEHALRYGGEREQFGRPLSGFGAVQEKLAGMAIRIAGARALLLQTAARAEGEDPGSALAFPSSLHSAAAMAKVAASEAAMWTSDEAVQIFGGYGYMRDYPVERLMRDAKGTEIYEGTNEVLRWIVARDAIREHAGD